MTKCLKNVFIIMTDEVTAIEKAEVHSRTPRVDKPAEVEFESRKTNLNKLPGIQKKTSSGWLQKTKSYLLKKPSGRWFAGIVVIPWIVSLGYFTGLASDRYVSEASFMIEKSDGGAPSLDGFSLLGISSQSGNDHKLLEAFINSPDMMLYLDKEVGLKQHYIESADFISSLSSDASYEAFLGYYRDHLKIRFNDVSGLLELEVQGFAPEFSKMLTEKILQRSEFFVNKISNDLANQQLQFIQGEVKLSELRLKDMSARLLAFQNKTGLLSAEAQGVALNSIMNELQSELVRNKTEFQTMKSYLNINSPQVVALKQRITAIQMQLDAETLRLTDGSKTTINDLAARQQELQLELELATKAYSSSLVALESARTEASRKLKQLVVVSSPQLSEEAKYPRVMYTLTNILLILLAVFGLIRMTLTTIREHRD